MHRPDRLVLHGSADNIRREKPLANAECINMTSLHERQQQQRRRVSELQQMYSGATNKTAMNKKMTLSSSCYSDSGALVMHQEPNTTLSSMSPSRPSPTSTSLSLSSQPLQQYVDSGESNIPLMEGPLPTEVREIIYSQCNGDKAELAERHARRLLSTIRRVRVYREELQSAMEEVGDIAQLAQRHELVQDALRVEVQGLDAKIEQLIRERELCKLQLDQEEELRKRKGVKLEEAKRRVSVLHSTIDVITKELVTGQVVLRQLVPNLHVENYIT